MNEYRSIIKYFDWSYEHQRTDEGELQAMTAEWKFRQEESNDLQADLRELGVQIPRLKASQMWNGGSDRDVMEQALLQLRHENNTMALRVARYGILRACTNFVEANGGGLTEQEKEMIIQNDEYLSNSDSE